MSSFGLINVEYPAFEFCNRFLISHLGEICEFTYMTSIIHTYLPEVVSNLLPASFPSRWVFITKQAIRYLPIGLSIWPATFQVPSILCPWQQAFVRPSLQRILALAVVGVTFSLSKLTQLALDRINPMIYPLTCLGLYYPFRWIPPLAGMINLDRGLDTVNALIMKQLIVPWRISIMSRRSDHFQRLLDHRMRTPPFKYPPLQSNTMIRLLKFENYTKDRSVITCDIEDTEISMAPPYDAVSYVWGDPRASSSLIIGSLRSHCISIAENACSVLAAVIPLEGTRYLWIDSICIDQSNPVEKAQQIPMMGEIYAGAREVICYLKPSSNDDTEVVNTFMNRSMMLMSSNMDYFETEDIGKAMGTAPLIPVDDPGWLALDRFISNEYWSRLWIIQEFVAAKQLTVLYGTAPCEFSMIYSAIRSRTHPSYLFRSGELMPPYAAIHIFGIMITRLAYLDGDLQAPLSQLVSGFGVARASVPADRVNALLGISEDNAILRLKPSPYKSTQEVYTDMVRHALSRGHFDTFAISGLCNPRNESDLEDLPSWVPDLTCPVLCRLYHYHTRGYEAGGGKESTLVNTDSEISLDGRELLVRGILFDKVQICSSDPDWTEIELDSLSAKGSIYELGFFPIRRVTEMRQLVKEHLPSTFHEQTQIDEAFWRTIVEDYDGSFCPSKVNYTRAISILERVWERYNQDHEVSDDLKTTLWAEYKSPHSDINDIIPGLDQDDWVQIGRIVCVLRYKTFAITENGYIAMVPPKTKPGDAIAIFLGCEVPQVLRKKDDTDEFWAHWGEAYVHGIMHGEALERPHERLVLR